ncbi:Hypothetical predicted protein [Olea europaea subsp. europaea]|uniref:Uncharacterized protein n=1 Tax=Olea europaea subsp. europaea TaxID=158383 RepID=A0A8S0RKS0_OLEEU|nr:Hypothetical predicted protein [Olea europaea subsp. europaea]
MLPVGLRCFSFQLGLSVPRHFQIVLVRCSADFGWVLPAKILGWSSPAQGRLSLVMGKKKVHQLRPKKPIRSVKRQTVPPVAVVSSSGVQTQHSLEGKNVTSNAIASNLHALDAS